MAARSSVKCSARAAALTAGLVFCVGLTCLFAAEGKILGRWLFDEGKGTVASDGVDGTADGRVVRAIWTEGRSSGALEFEDYSLIDYLKPDVKKATRVVIPNVARLNPKGPFTLRAVIYPTRDPLYYGGIFEKGAGYGAVLRLILLRGLKLRAIYGSGGKVDGSAPISLDAWHAVEVRYDGSSLTLRMDGKEVGRAAGVEPARPTDDKVVIGERFTGKIDEVVLTSP